MRRLLLLALLALPANALATDFAAEAEAMMDLDYRIDEVQARSRKAAKEAYAPAPAAAPADPYAYQYAAPPPIPMLDLEPNSDVEQVVVFADRAVVTRVLKAKVEKGVTSVQFEGLPLGVAADSLHAQTRDGQARIVGVELVSGVGDVDDEERIAKLKDEMRPIADQLGEVRDRIEALLAQRAYLRSSLTGSGDRPAPTLDQVKGTLTFVGDAERRIAAELRKELDLAEELDEDLRPLLIKLDNPLATGMTVRIDLDSPKAEEVELALRYQVFGARWWPSYNARLDPATKRVALEYYGIVAQSTGEEWTNASLLLSTADASVSGSLPQLQAWFLGRDGYTDAGLLASLEVGRGATTDPVTDATRADVPSGDVTSAMSAQIRGSGAVVFAIPGQRSIAGDGSEQRVPIGNQTFPAAIELATVPKVVPEVYQNARFRYEGQAPLLPGTVSSFVDTDYVGAGAIGAKVPGEEVSLAFGTDETLKVQRTLVSRNQEFIGAGKKMVRYTFQFRIQVQNFGPDARTVLVTDQVPISEIDRVDVQVLDGTPPLPAQQDDPAGVRRWEVTVPPGGAQSIDMSFVVTAPREVRLYALEALF